MLKVLRVSFFIFFALAVGAFSVWLHYHGITWWLAAIVALGSFAALLSGYFWGSSDALHNKAIKLIFEFALSNTTRAIISNVVILIVALLLCFLALNAKPDQTNNYKPEQTNYYEVRVFNQVDMPGNYQTGTKVTLHTRTDGLTHQELVGEDGGAVFRKVPNSTNFNYQLDVISAVPPFITGGSENINGLPGLMKIDISDIPTENRKSKVSVSPETIANVNQKTPNYLENADERGDVGLQSSNAPWGVPHAELILNRLGYVLGYKLDQKMLSWVAYSIFPTDEYIPRPPGFLLDPAIPKNAQASISDYRGSGYDRGHMISPADLYFKGPIIVEEAFYLSTVTPQAPFLNRIIWRELEIRVREIVNINQQPVYVIAGPLFISPTNDPSFKFETIGNGNIPVPTHFFRIMAKQINNKLKVFALIVPNVDESNLDLRQYLVSVDEVERKSGLDFFPLLNSQLATVIEEEVGELW